MKRYRLLRAVPGMSEQHDDDPEVLFLAGYVVREEDHAAALRAKEAECEGLLAENDRLRQDRSDALSVYSKEGLLSSEWIARTGKAERERNEAQRDLAEARAALQTALGHSNCYCDTCKELARTFWSPPSASALRGEEAGP